MQMQCLGSFSIFPDYSFGAKISDVNPLHHFSFGMLIPLGIALGAFGEAVGSYGHPLGGPYGPHHLVEHFRKFGIFNLFLQNSVRQ